MHTNLGVLFSGNSCARKMLHLWLAGYEDVSSFLNQLKLKGKFRLAYLLYLAQRKMANYMHTNLGVLFSGNSFARKMLHLWLAGYDDVSSFLNQLKQKGKFGLAYLIYLAQREMANYMHTNLGVLFSGNSCARKMPHLWLADYEDVSSFLNQLKMKGKFRLAYLLYLAQRKMANYMHTNLGVLFSGNSFARKMLHLWLAGYEDVLSFLNQLKLKGKFGLAYLIYLAQREVANYMHTNLGVLFSGNSCARKVLHHWLAGYEDVSSFLNQLKLKGKFGLAYLIYLAQREMTNYMHNLVLVIMRILLILHSNLMTLLQTWDLEEIALVNNLYCRIDRLKSHHLKKNVEYQKQDW